MKKLAIGTAVMLAVTLLSTMLVIPGCASQSHPIAIPYLPPSYYDCTETDMTTLTQAYFARYNNIPDAENVLKGRIFVFKNIQLTEAALKHATDEYIWVNNTLKCYWLDNSNLKQLNAKEMFDVVGVDAGICQDYGGMIIFTGCVFLPAGSVQLPAGGSSPLTLTY